MDVGVAGAPPPPPQPTHRARASATTARGAQARRQANRRPASSGAPNAANIANIHNPIHGPAGGLGFGPSAEAAVVVTVTVVDTALLPFKAKGEGDTEQVESEGAPLQEKLTD